jgi:hypothetical protein
MMIRYSFLRQADRLFGAAGRTVPPEFRQAVLLHGILPLVGTAAGVGTLVVFLGQILKIPTAEEGPVTTISRALAPAWFETPILIALLRIALLVLTVRLGKETSLDSVAERSPLLLSVALVVISIPVFDTLIKVFISVALLSLGWVIFHRIMFGPGLTETMPDNEERRD